MISATNLMNICDMLEGNVYIVKSGHNQLTARLNDMVGLKFSTDENFRNELLENINNMMFLDNENKMQYKEF